MTDTPTIAERILAILQATDQAIPTGDIARQLGTAGQNVRYQLERLADQGLIEHVEVLHYTSTAHHWQATKTTITDDQILTVARAHGTTVAAGWSGRSTNTVLHLRQRVDGYQRGRGRPTRAEVAAQQYRPDCDCRRCQDETGERRNAAIALADARYRSIQPTVRRLDDDGEPDDQSCKDEGNCRGQDVEFFFPTRGASTTEQKEVCRGCVVREQCLEYAIANGEKFGIWGGLSERERRRIRRQRSLDRRAS